MNAPLTILALETSCDETAAAVVQLRAGKLVALSNAVINQDHVHAMYGGVVPELASRAHLEKLLPAIRAAMSDAKISFGQLDAVAVGIRPGLIGSLLVGVSAAKALAWLWMAQASCSARPISKLSAKDAAAKCKSGSLSAQGVKAGLS